MKCQSCGFENLDHSVRCMGCGVPLTDAEPAAPPPPLTAEDIEELGLYTPLMFERIEAGEVISRSLKIYFGNFVPFFVVSFAASLPVLMVQIWALTVQQNPNPDPELVLALTAAFFGVSILVYPFATAALTYGVLQRLRDRPVGVGELVRVGLRMMVTVFAVAILQWLATFVGFLLLIIPGIIMSLALAVAIPAAVEERPGAFASLRRSFELTRGFRGKIFVMFFGLGLLNLALVIPVVIASFASQVVGQVLDSIRQVIYTGLAATAVAVLYYQLRSVKESLDLNELASVFD